MVEERREEGHENIFARDVSFCAKFICRHFPTHSNKNTTMVTNLLLFFLVFGVSCFTVVKAACDNQCSGHGTCGTDDVCTCYDNWGIGLSHDSGDCSDRICPYELAWVDKPNLSGTFHKYAECAGRGICSRDTGECVCFAGYEGMACQRMSCPNGCSGQGTCEYIEDLPYQSTWNEYTNNPGFDPTWMTYNYTRKFSYHQWDFMKSRACICDAQYGDADCSKRMCPYGNDVLDNREFVLVSHKYQKQKIVFAAANSALDLKKILMVQLITQSHRCRRCKELTIIRQRRLL